MTKKSDFKNAKQKKKCWMYTIISSPIFVSFFVIIGVIGRQTYDILGVIVIFLIALWEFYRIYKFYLITQFKNRAEKTKCIIYSLVCGILIAFMLIAIGKIIKLEFIDTAVSVQFIMLVPLIFFKNLSMRLHSFLLKSKEIKKEKFKTWIYALLSSFSFAALLYSTNITSKKEEFHPIIILSIFLIFFLGMCNYFDIEKGKKLTRSTKTLIIFASIFVGILLIGLLLFRFK